MLILNMAFSLIATFLAGVNFERKKLKGTIFFMVGIYFFVAAIGVANPI